MSQQLGIRLVYDLRSAVEIARGLDSKNGFPIREWEGSERKFVPVFLDQDYSPEALALRYKNYAAESAEVSQSFTFKRSRTAFAADIVACMTTLCIVSPFDQSCLASLQWRFFVGRQSLQHHVNGRTHVWYFLAAGIPSGAGETIPF